MKKTWTDKNAHYDLREHPLFRKWYNSDWWQEMAFIFGQVTPSASPWVWADESGAPILFSKADREIRCERKGAYPSHCRLQDKDLRTDMKFSSVHCQENL